MNETEPMNWIMVANDEYAKIFLNRGLGTGLRPLYVGEIEGLVNQAEPDKEEEKVGFFGKLFGKKIVHLSFGKDKKSPFIKTKDITGIVNRCARKKVFNSLVLIAPKHVITFLHQNMSIIANDLVEGELIKDLFDASEYEIEKHIRLISRL